MSAIATKVPHLLGGVSQLPHEQRHPSTVASLENAHLSTTHGLRKRPPSQALATLDGLPEDYYGATFVYGIDRRDDERYIVVVANGDLKVYDTETGEEQLVTFPDGKDYLDAGARGFRAFTVGDHTFLVNRSETVLRGSTRTGVRVPEALIFVRQVDFSTEYSVTVDGEEVSISTGAATSEFAQAALSTRGIAYALHYKLSVETERVKDAFTFTNLGSTIHVVRNDGADFSISASDSLADKGLRIVKGKVEALEDLPARARDGMVVEVVGAPGSDKDNTWVRYEDTGDTEGLWRECPAPDMLLDIDASTMPHELVRQGKLSPPLAATGIPRQPTVTTKRGTEYLTGWTTDGADETINDDETKSVELDADLGAVRSPAVLGSHATAERMVEVAFDVDTSQVRAGALAVVTLRADTGSGWTALSTKTFRAGVVVRGVVIREQMVVPVGTRFELALDIKTAFAKAPTDSRRARVIARGTDDTPPGIKVSELPATYIQTGLLDQVWPRGLVVTLTIDAVEFTTTLTEDKTTEELNAALVALIDADAGFAASYNPFTERFAWGALLGFEVSTAAGAPVDVMDASFQFPAATKFWNPDGTMVPDAHVGRTFKNLSDGSTGTIVSNSETAVEVDALTGGTTNEFNVGDQCAVLGDGVALFVFQQAPWGQRLVGNDTLSPYPSFVDRQISDVFFYAGRLGFTAEDRILLSAVDDPYRFWRATVTQVLDNDPIDIQSAHKDVGVLDSAVQWNGQLLVCSSAGHQLSLQGDPQLTPATVRLEHLASYPMADKVRPLVLGGSALFPRSAGGYTSYRELFRTQDGSYDSRTLTQHVQRYIEGDILEHTGDGDIGLLVCRTDADGLYLLNMISVSNEEQHLAWHKWTVGTSVLGMHLSGGYLYLVVNRGAAVTLERINVAAPALSGAHLDAGAETYTFSVVLNRHYLRDRHGNPLTHGRTQVRTVEINHQDTGYYRVEVENDGKAPKQYEVDTQEGRKRVPVLAQNDACIINIVNYSNSGCGISSVEWEATYGDRSRRW